VSRKIGWVVILLLLVGGIGWYMLSPAESDQQQIKDALNNAIKASRQGQAGGVMELLSSNFKLNDVHYAAGLDVEKAINRLKPDVEVQKPDPVINGDSATITSPVRLSILSRSLDLSSVTFVFKREHDKKWLVIPSTNWKLESASIPPEVEQQFLTQWANPFQ
jgi:hypothetical protein